MFNYIAIADRLSTVSWSNDSNPNGVTVVNSVYGITVLQLTAKAM